MALVVRPQARVGSKGYFENPAPALSVMAEEPIIVNVEEGEHETLPEQVTVVVATFPSFAGVPFVVVQ